MVSINHAIRTVKEDLANLLEPESIFGICREVGHTWRRSLLNPAVLIHLFVMQILLCNTACTHLRLVSGLSVTASAYCQARKRLPLKVIRLLVERHPPQPFFPRPPLRSSLRGRRGMSQGWRQACRRMAKRGQERMPLS